MTMETYNITITYAAYDEICTDNFTFPSNWKWVMYDEVVNSCSYFTVIENTQENIDIIKQYNYLYKLPIEITDLGRYFIISMKNVKKNADIPVISLDTLNDSLDLRDYYCVVTNNTLHVIERIYRLGLIIDPDIIICDIVSNSENKIETQQEVSTRNLEVCKSDEIVDYYDPVKSKTLFYSLIYRILMSMGIEWMHKCVNKSINWHHNSTPLLCLPFNDVIEVMNYTHCLTGNPIYKKLYFSNKE